VLKLYDGLVWESETLEVVVVCLEVVVEEDDTDEMDEEVDGVELVVDEVLDDRDCGEVIMNVYFRSRSNLSCSGSCPFNFSVEENGGSSPSEKKLICSNIVP